MTKNNWNNIADREFYSMPTEWQEDWQELRDR